MGSVDDRAPCQPWFASIAHHGLPGAEEFLESGFLVAEFGVDVGGEVERGNQPGVEVHEAQELVGVAGEDAAWLDVVGDVSGDLEEPKGEVDVQGGGGPAWCAGVGPGFLTPLGVCYAGGGGVLGGLQFYPEAL